MSGTQRIGRRFYKEPTYHQNGIRFDRIVKKSLIIGITLRSVQSKTFRYFITPDVEKAAKEKGVIVAVCHVLRYHPYFMKIKELIDTEELGRIISINHRSSVGIARSTHTFRYVKISDPFTTFAI